jgi:RND family efflux transporter MFP subunit
MFRLAGRLLERHRGWLGVRTWIIAGIMLVTVPGLVHVYRSSDATRELPQSELAASELPVTDWELDAGIDEEAIEWAADSEVALADEVDSAGLDCMLKPWEQVSLRSPVTGRIDAIHTESADLVQPGALLVELDSDLALADLELARKRAEMTASIHSLEARSKLVLERGKRAKQLYANKAMALDARDEILTEQAIARYELEEARDQHALAELELARAHAAYEQRRIRSPVAGIVVDRLMSVGEVVDEETVLEIAQIDPLRVEVILPAAEFGTVEVGMKAAVIPEFPGDEVRVATVRVVDRIIDSASGTFGAELELPNPKHQIPEGLRCRVQFVATDDDLEALVDAEPRDEREPIAAPQEPEIVSARAEPEPSGP